MSLEDYRLHTGAIAKVLSELSNEIEHLGARLCSDPDFALNHIEELQSIDVISQKQRALAQLLEADCPKNAMSTLGLDMLAGRLHSLTQAK